ncbi:MAG: homocysteine S-methyltransferase family protein [Candidatus Latescibacterota bacterium]
MSSFLNHVQHAPLLCDGAMGSLLFERTGRLSEQNHLYETFNADHPDLVRQVHLEYLQAGATVLTTNTFAANHAHLAAHDQSDRVRELNREGVLLAREAIDQYRPHRRADDPCFVIGSIGPTPDVRESPQEVRAIYRPQIEALINAGIDALLLETFTSLVHVSAVLEVVHSLSTPVPVVVHMALHQRANDSWDLDPLLFAKTAADMRVHILGVNCCAPWEAQAFLDTVSELEPVQTGRIQLSLMPNGGDFRRIGHRYLTGVNPEFMGRFARQSAQRGVHLLGGCCDVHPAHINEMHNYLRSLHKTQIQSQMEWDNAHDPTPAETKRDNGPFSRKIFGKEFAVSVELLPSRGTGGIKARMRFIGELAASGLADALDLTDGSRGIPLMPPGDFIHLIRHRLGWKTEDALELIPHFTLRDLNTMGLQSRLIGYWANRIHNVLLITGDPPKMSPTYPRSSAVFDMDSATLIRYVQNYLNAGVDFGGQKLGSHRDPRTRFTVGTGFEPEALDMESEIEKLERKLEARVDYIMTQPVFNHAALDALTPFREQSAVLIGVLILANADHARRMAAVPGMVVPDEVLARLARFDKAEDQAAAGAELAAEQVQRIRREGWSGVYLMSPASHGRIIDVLREGLG